MPPLTHWRATPRHRFDTIGAIFAGTTVAEIDSLPEKCAAAVKDMVAAFAISDYYDDRVLNALTVVVSKAILSVDEEDSD